MKSSSFAPRGFKKPSFCCVCGGFFLLFSVWFFCLQLGFRIGSRDSYEGYRDNLLRFETNWPMFYPRYHLVRLIPPASEFQKVVFCIKGMALENGCECGPFVRIPLHARRRWSGTPRGRRRTPTPASRRRTSSASSPPSPPWPRCACREMGAVHPFPASISSWMVNVQIPSGPKPALFF